MDPVTHFGATAINLMCMAVGAGLIARRRWALSAFFAAYIAFGLVTNRMVVWYPSRFYHQWFILVMQTGFDVLKLGIALELAWRTFRPFAGARSSAFLIALIIVSATALAASLVPGRDAWEWEDIIGEFC